MKYYLFSLCMIFTLFSIGCINNDDDEPTVNQAEVDRQLIRDYIRANNLQADSTVDGLFYVIEKEGNGKFPSSTSSVSTHYEGRLLDGTKFDSSYDRNEPSTFSLTRVITGWRLGIPLFSEGGGGTLIIPSNLGYGAQGSAPVIPPNAVLVFKIELLDVL